MVVAGYQGVDANGNITTLGRGASDLTAVALAAVMKANACEIYTDVDGVYRPIRASARARGRLNRISYDEMSDGGVGCEGSATALGRAARRFNVPLRVLQFQ